MNKTKNKKIPKENKRFRMMRMLLNKNKSSTHFGRIRIINQELH